MSVFAEGGRGGGIHMEPYRLHPRRLAVPFGQSKGLACFQTSLAYYQTGLASRQPGLLSTWSVVSLAFCQISQNLACCQLGLACCQHGLAYCQPGLALVRSPSPAGRFVSANHRSQQPPCIGCARPMCVFEKEWALRETWASALFVQLFVS